MQESLLSRKQARVCFYSSSFFSFFWVPLVSSFLVVRAARILRLSPPRPVPDFKSTRDATLFLGCSGLGYDPHEKNNDWDRSDCSAAGRSTTGRCPILSRSFDEGNFACSQPGRAVQWSLGG